MNDLWKTSLGSQFGAALDMLENAVTACPAALWGDRTQQPEFWYTVYHTLFWLDFYLSDSAAGFAPPAPYTLDEMDPAGLLPARVYTREEMLEYLRHGRAKCRVRIEGLTGELAARRWVFGRRDFSVAELLLYTMRHVQHHAGQLNALLRRHTGSAPRWVGRAQAGRA
ncbi:MAG TPA: DinB family protein [Candidatus Saccharimonadales bacterium]|nr:DinB family protein [Candidatus Saccharimonadales bacterium]